MSGAGDERPTGRSALVERIVPQPGPRDPVAVRRWSSLAPETRGVLRRAATDVELARSVDDDLRVVVADLAVHRSRRQPLDVVVPAVTGLLVLSTVWGFGRAVLPDAATAWLVAGLLLGSLAAATGLRRVAVRRRDAAAVLRALPGPTGEGPPGEP